MDIIAGMGMVVQSAFQTAPNLCLQQYSSSSHEWERVIGNLAGDVPVFLIELFAYIAKD